MSNETLKQQVAEAAVKFVEATLEPDDLLGVGTGSTVNYFIDRLAESNAKFKGAISSSEVSEERLRSVGIDVIAPNGWIKGKLYVDGADEVDPGMALTKGGGGALTREKITASMCEEFLCLVDESKLVDVLGEFPLPIEVIPMAQFQVALEIETLGGEARLREEFTSDNGNVILDVHGLRIDDPEHLERQLNCIPGIVDNGIFAHHRPYLSFIGRDCCVEVRGSSKTLDCYSTEIKAIETSCPCPIGCC